MSLTALDYQLQPNWIAGALWAVTTSLGSTATFVFNAAADKIGFVFRATGSVPDSVSFLVTAHTSTGTIDATLETIDSSGLPSGTPVTNSATASVSVTGTGVKTTATGMAGTASLTIGELYAVVLSATGGFAGTFTVSYAVGATVSESTTGPLTKDSAGAWTKNGGGTMGTLLGLKNAGGSYFFVYGLAGPVNAVPALQSYSSATNPDERGNRFVPDVPCTCYGALFFCTGGSTPGANDGIDVFLYSTPTTSISQLQTKVIGGAQQVSLSAHIVQFETPQDLTAGVEYGITVRATGSETQAMARWDYAANSDLASMYGVDFYAITRNDATGNATAQNAQIYAVFPIFSRFGSDTGGSGGILYVPNLDGI